MDFHGQLKDQNKNNATTITATQNYEIRLSSSLPEIIVLVILVETDLLK